MPITDPKGVEIDAATPDPSVVDNNVGGRRTSTVEHYNFHRVSLDVLLVHLGGVDVTVGLSAMKHAAGLQKYGENRVTPPRRSLYARLCPCLQPISFADFHIPEYQVRRGGEFQNVSMLSLVPGDIVLLQMGDKVPADMRVIKVIEDLKMDTTNLTGEPDLLSKDSRVSSESHFLEATNLVLVGSYCAGGSAECVVLKTGDATVWATIVNL